MFLNDGVAQYFCHLNEVAEGQFDKTTALSITANTDTITLPSDFYTIKALYRPLNTTMHICNYNNNVVESYDAQPATSATAYIPEYYLRVNSLVLRPIPGFSESGSLPTNGSSGSGLVLEYTAFPDTMINGGDSLTAGISPLFKELVVMYAVYKAKLKDDLVNGGNSRAPVQAHLGDLYNNFKKQVVSRSKYPTNITPFSP